MAGFSFAPRGLRTDGRPFREHRPWRVNDGRETANRSTAQGPQTPRTDFSAALTPRMGGPGGPLAPNPALRAALTPSTSFAQQEIARRQAELASPLWAAYRPAPPSESQPGTVAGEDQIAPLNPSLTIPSDTDAPSGQPMLANVTDAGAEVLNTAQQWTRAGKAAAAGYAGQTPRFSDSAGTQSMTRRATGLRPGDYATASFVPGQNRARRPVIAKTDLSY